MSASPGQAWTDADIRALESEMGLPAGGPGERASAGRDFGGLVERPVTCVIAPRTTEELVRVITFANGRRLGVTVRGGGMSQGGQSIPRAGVSVHLSGLGGVESPDAGSMTILCGAGASWRDVLEKSAPHGLMPKVVPLNLDLTVGGVLSVAGLGATSHRYGPAVACVAELEVVTGGGRRVTCDEARDRGVFDAALSGLGRAGIITAARLELRRFKPEVRTFYLLYDTIHAWLRDYRAIIASGRADHLEGFCSPCVQGLRRGPAGRGPFAQWFYGLHVSIEHEPGDAPDASSALAGLEPYKLVHVEDGETVAHASRYEPRFAAMRSSGAWQGPHPWVESWLPGERVHEVLPSVLEMLPLALGEGPRFVFVNRHRMPPFLALPEGPELGVCAFLPAAVPPFILPAVLDALRAIHDRMIAADGKRMLAGWISMMDEAALRDHHGERHAAWAAARKELDPRGVLDSPLAGRGAHDDVED